MRMIHLAIVILLAAANAIQNLQTVSVSFLRTNIQAPFAFLIAVVYLFGTLTGGSLLALVRRLIGKARG